MKRFPTRLYESCCNSTTRPHAVSHRRCFHTCRQWLDQPAASPQSEVSDENHLASRIKRHDSDKGFVPPEARQPRFAPRAQQDTQTYPRLRRLFSPAPWQDSSAEVGLFIDAQPHRLSALLLRDLCECPSCVDQSTKQKLFSTAEIPPAINARAVAQTKDGVSILWDSDVPGYDRGHTTDIGLNVLRSLVQNGLKERPMTLRRQTLWNAEAFSKVADIDYEAYMHDDTVLHQALHQLHTHGLLFVSNVPDTETSVSTIGERIGPIKNTFYGYTWDVRSVPEAKNVAYTSQNLGFHMDLLYMKQPPHIQLLHCIRSSAQGGASLFTDSHRAAQELFTADLAAFDMLARMDVTYHYNHPTTNLYRQERPVFEMKPLRSGGKIFKNVLRLAEEWKEVRRARPLAFPESLDITSYLDTVAWSPPFQGPFSIRYEQMMKSAEPDSPVIRLNRKIQSWHAAAREFNALIHRPEAIYERMMRPGECVIFDNRRVLHARRAFEVGDAGTERWLRGAYLDKDPYMSKLQVLHRQFGGVVEEAQRTDGNDEGSVDYFEAAASV